MPSLVSRRVVLAGAGSAAVAGAATISGSQAVSSFASLLKPSTTKGRRGVPLKSATYDDWLLQVGSKFTTDTGHVLSLASVRSFPAAGDTPAGVREQAFVARFEISKGSATLTDRIYRMAHPDGGTFDMFITRPDAKAPKKMLAIFS